MQNSAWMVALERSGRITMCMARTVRTTSACHLRPATLAEDSSNRMCGAMLTMSVIWASRGRTAGPVLEWHGGTSRPPPSRDTGARPAGGASASRTHVWPAACGAGHPAGPARCTSGCTSGRGDISLTFPYLAYSAIAGLSNSILRLPTSRLKFTHRCPDSVLFSPDGPHWDTSRPVLTPDLPGLAPFLAAYDMRCAASPTARGNIFPFPSGRCCGLCCVVPARVPASVA